jgi:hypothetical protein
VKSPDGASARLPSSKVGTHRGAALRRGVRDGYPSYLVHPTRAGGPTRLPLSKVGTHRGAPSVGASALIAQDSTADGSSNRPYRASRPRWISKLPCTPNPRRRPDAATWSEVGTHRRGVLRRGVRVDRARFNGGRFIEPSLPRFASAMDIQATLHTQPAPEARRGYLVQGRDAPRGGPPSGRPR